MATTSQLLEELNRQKILAQQVAAGGLQNVTAPSVGITRGIVNTTPQNKATTPVVATPKPIDTSFYDNQMSQYEAKRMADAEQAKKEAEAQYAEQQRQAYVSKLQNDRLLEERLAQAGIKGGGTETANLKLLTGYQNTQNKLNADKMAAITGIGKGASDDIFNFGMTNAQAKNAYIEQLKSEKRQAKREDAVTKSQRKYDDKWKRKQLKQDRKQEKKADKKEYYSAKYSTYNNIKSLQKALKKAKTSLEKTIINARIGYLKDKKKK